MDTPRSSWLIRTNSERLCKMPVHSHCENCLAAHLKGALLCWDLEKVQGCEVRSQSWSGNHFGMISALWLGLSQVFMWKRYTVVKKGCIWWVTVSNHDMVSDWCSNGIKGTIVCRRCEVGLQSKTWQAGSGALFLPFCSLCARDVQKAASCVRVPCASFDFMYHLPAELCPCLFLFQKMHSV